MYSCKYAGGQRARWGLGSHEVETGTRSVSRAVRLGPGWSLEDLGWADVTGLVGQRALDKAGAAEESPHIRLRQV